MGRVGGSRASHACVSAAGAAAHGVVRRQCAADRLGCGAVQHAASRPPMLPDRIAEATTPSTPALIDPERRCPMFRPTALPHHRRAGAPSDPPIGPQAGPLAGLTVHRPLPDPRRPDLHPAAGRPRRRGDQGGEARRRRRHAELGPALRRPTPRADRPPKAPIISAPIGTRGSVTLDIARPEGQGLLRELLAGCDVLIENFRTGHAGALGPGLGRPEGRLPRLGLLRDQRLRPDRALPRPRRLRTS